VSRHSEGTDQLAQGRQRPELWRPSFSRLTLDAVLGAQELLEAVAEVGRGSQEVAVCVGEWGYWTLSPEKTCVNRVGIGVGQTKNT